MTTLHDFTLPAIDGLDRSLEDLEGKVALVVNVASRCGLTPQYEGLQRLHEEYGARASPSSDSLATGSRARSLAPRRRSRRSALHVRGHVPALREGRGEWPGQTPSLRLADLAADGARGPGDVQWNFGKFLVGKDGAVRARFEPTVAPDDAALVAAIELALSE